MLWGYQSSRRIDCRLYRTWKCWAGGHPRMTQEERNSSPFSFIQDEKQGGGWGKQGCSKSNHICLISDPQSSGEPLRAPGFPLTLSAHSACFTGRILEAGMSLQARAGGSCSRAVPGWNSGHDGRGPQARGQATSGRKAATVGPGMWLSFPGGSFSICEK